MATATPAKLGPYEIIAPLGAGGMGQVFRARDPRLDREVALKILHTEVAGDPDRQRRFSQEARAASSLNHPNIVTVHDFAAEGTTAYIVTELVDGESLGTLLERGPLPLKKALDIAVQVSEGLAAAHDAGIVHRDIKPANIMVTKSGLVKILDFGLAKQQARTRDSDETVAAETIPGMVMGTVAYMSPEQGLGQQLDARSDQFSFGLVLYRMLTGRAAFEGNNPMSTLAAIIEQDHRPVGELTPNVPAPLRWCVDRCLAKDREHRYTSTRDLNRELVAIRTHLSEITSGPIAAASASLPVAAPVHSSRRHWVAAGLAVAGVVFFSLLAAYLRADYHVDLAKYELRPLASEAAVQSNPAWSHDGRSIAYVAEVAGIQQVFVRELAAPMPAQLTRDTADCEMPFWSADGMRVFYIRRDAAGPALWSVGTAGGAPQLIREKVARAALTPDGATMAYLEIDAGAENPLALWIGPPGKDPQRYTLGPFASHDFRTGYIAWAPDGKRLGAWLARWNGSSEFWVLPTPQGQPAKSFGIAQGVYPFVWMPDNRRVLFGGAVPGSMGADLQFVELTSQALTPITVTPREALQPSISPDGQSIVFTASDTESDLVELPLDGGPGRNLLSSARSESDPSWMHSGDQFAYSSDRTGIPEIWLKNRRDGSERPLVGAKDFPKLWVLALTEPAISPDDQRVAYAVLGSNGHAIYLSNVRGGPPLRLYDGSGDQRGPSWSPDGNWVAFQALINGRWTLMKASSGGGQATPIFDHCLPGHPKWSPTGDWISFQTADGLSLIHPDGTGLKVVNKGRWITQGWEVTGKAIYGIKQGTNRRLTRIDLQTGTEHELTDSGLPAHAQISGFSPHPGGNAVAVAVGKPRGDIWLLRGFPQPRSFLRRMLPY